MILSPNRQKADMNLTIRGQAPQVQWYRIARYTGRGVDCETTGLDQVTG